MTAIQTKNAPIAKAKDAPSADEQLQSAIAKNADLETEIKVLSDSVGSLIAKFANSQANENDATPEARSTETAMQKQIASMADQIKSLHVEQAGHKSTIEKSGDTDEVTYKSACDDYIRKGIEMLGPKEIKALSAGVDADGGYTVYDHQSSEILTSARELVPMRRLARVMTIATGRYVQPKKLTGNAKGWVGETAGKTNTTTATLGQLSVPVMEMESTPSATTTLLQDSSADIEAWLASELMQDFAELENAGFISGTGSINNQPEGLLAYAGGYVDNGLYASGKIGTISTGTAGAFGAGTAGYDTFINLIAALKEGYHNGAKFVMRRTTWAEIMKIKDANGDPLFFQTPGDTSAPWGRIMGYPIELTDDMTAIATNSYSIAFGDFNRGYLIVDRVGMTVLRDPYSNKPHVDFYTRKRVGGGVRDEQAIKLMKFAV